MLKLTTPESTFNLFGALDWVAKKGWSLVSKCKINDNLVAKANSNNDKVIE